VGGEGAVQVPADDLPVDRVVALGAGADQDRVGTDLGVRGLGQLQDVVAPVAVGDQRAPGQDSRPRTRSWTGGDLSSAGVDPGRWGS